MIKKTKIKIKRTNHIMIFRFVEQDRNTIQMTQILPIIKER